jgi:uncharacterized protein CbrC (UPF0167 family)
MPYDPGPTFRLYRDDLERSSDYAGKTTCTVCGVHDVCFRFGIGGSLIRPCHACDTTIAIDTDDPATDCPSCGASNPRPPGEIVVCHTCLRAGHAAYAVDTEVGMVTWERAQAGEVGSIPAGHLPPAWAHLARGKDPDDMVRVPIAPEHLHELTRTPRYSSWQGECWLFHEGRPMAFVGEWSTATFDEMADDGDGRALLDRCLAFVPAADRDWIWTGLNNDAVCVYVFQSLTDPSHFAATYDMD